MHNVTSNYMTPYHRACELSNGNYAWWPYHKIHIMSFTNSNGVQYIISLHSGETWCVKGLILEVDKFEKLPPGTKITIEVNNA